MPAPVDTDERATHPSSSSNSNLSLLPAFVHSKTHTRTLPTTNATSGAGFALTHAQTLFLSLGTLLHTRRHLSFLPASPACYAEILLLKDAFIYKEKYKQRLALLPEALILTEAIITGSACGVSLLANLKKTAGVEGRRAPPAARSPPNLSHEYTDVALSLPSLSARSGLLMALPLFLCRCHQLTALVVEVR